MALMPAKTSRKLAALAVAMALVFTLGPAEAACLCGTTQHTGCATHAAREDAPSSAACTCCAASAAENVEPSGCGPHASADTNMHRCDCAASAAHVETAVLASAAAQSAPKPCAPILLADATTAPHSGHAGKHRGEPPAAVLTAANPPPSYLLACAFLT